MANEKNRVGVIPGLALLLSLLALLLIGLGGLRGFCGNGDVATPERENAGMRLLADRVAALEAERVDAKVAKIARTRMNLAALAPDLPESVQPALSEILNALGAYGDGLVGAPVNEPAPEPAIEPEAEEDDVP